MNGEMTTGGFRSSPWLWLSIGFLTIISLLALFAPWVTPFNYDQQLISERLQGPSWTHWMGTDILGRDLYSRLVYGARLSLSIGVLTAISALVLGTWVGSLSGYFGGWLDTILMRSVDILAIFPAPLLAILLMVLFGRGFLGLFIALSMTSWVTQARIVRGEVLKVRELPYIEAAHSIGASHFRTLTRHILPNIMTPIIASLTIQIPTNMMSESLLSFIGLGLQPPFSSWGTLANEGFQAMQSYPHLILFPGLTLFITMFALNQLGDALNSSFKLMDIDHKG